MLTLTSMIVFHSNVCPKLVLTAILGGSSPESSLMHYGFSFEIIPICRAFQNSVYVVNKKKTNQARWLVIPWFVPLLSRGYPWGIFGKAQFGYQYPWWGCCAQNVLALKGKNVLFPNYRENQVYGDSMQPRPRSITCLSGVLQAGTVCFKELLWNWCLLADKY